MKEIFKNQYQDLKVLIKPVWGLKQQRPGHLQSQAGIQKQLQLHPLISETPGHIGSQYIFYIIWSHLTLKKVINNFFFFLTQYGCKRASNVSWPTQESCCHVVLLKFGQQAVLHQLESVTGALTDTSIGALQQYSICITLCMAERKHVIKKLIHIKYQLKYCTGVADSCIKAEIGSLDVYSQFAH